MDGFQNTYFTQHLLSAHFKYLQLPNKSLTLSKVSCTAAAAAAAAVPSTNRDKNCYPLCLHQAFLCCRAVCLLNHDGNEWWRWWHIKWAVNGGDSTMHSCCFPKKTTYRQLPYSWAVWLTSRGSPLLRGSTRNDVTMGSFNNAASLPRPHSRTHSCHPALNCPTCSSHFNCSRIWRLTVLQRHRRPTIPQGQ